MTNKVNKSIPCKQCPVLAMCKTKALIQCVIIGKKYMRIPFGHESIKANDLFMNRVIEYLGYAEWSMFGNMAYLYKEPILSDEEENRMWQSMGYKNE